MSHATQAKPEDAEPLGAYDTPPALARAILDRVVAVVPELTGDASRQYEQILEPHVGSGAFLRAMLDRWPDPFDSPGIEVYDLDPFAPGIDLAPDRVTVSPYGAPHRHTLGRLQGTCPICGDWFVGRTVRALCPDHAVRRKPCPGSGQPVMPPDAYDVPDPVRCGFLTTAPKFRPTIVLGNPPYGARVPWRPKNPEPVAHLHVAHALAVSGRHVFQVLRQSWIAPDRHRELTDSGHLRAVWTIRPRPPFAWFGTTKGTDSGPSALYWWDKSWTAPRYPDGSVRFEGGFLDWNEK